MSLTKEKTAPDREVLLRKHQITLDVAGKGVVAFGVWSVIKVVLALVFYNNRLLEMLYNPETGESVSLLRAYAMAALLLAGLLAIRLYVGLSAISEGRGGRYAPGYALLAGLMCVAELYSIVVSAMGFSVETGDLGDFLTTVIVELTSFIVTLDLVISAIRIRRLRSERG